MSESRPSRLTFEFDGGVLDIELAQESAPETIDTLLRCLPWRFDLHCAKIAGSHILWHAPFVQPAERGRDILSAPPGAFVYWPERQFLELIYAPLQAEAAEISYLGQVRIGVEVLRALGERVRIRQGLEEIWAQLRLPDGGHPTPVVSARDWLEAFATHRREIWRTRPPSIDALLARRGIMLPIGPLLMAENDARKLQELAWRFLGQARSGDPVPAAEAMRLVIESAEARLVGLCALGDVAPALAEARKLLTQYPAQATIVLEELVLYAGRLAAWLDLAIPWQHLSDTLVAALEERAMSGGSG